MNKYEYNDEYYLPGVIASYMRIQFYLKTPINK